MINSRNLEDLAAKPREVCQRMISMCHDSGIELLITATFRDAEYQAELYKIGRTKEISRKPVTNAAAGESWHNFRCAWDVVPLIGGKCAWEDAGLWEHIVQIGRAAGAECGADFRTFPDRPHFQLLPSPGFTLAAARVLWAQTGDVWARGKV